MVKPYSPHPPSPKQEAFLHLDAEEVLFGGAAGSGKSDALLLAALQYVDVPGYSAGIFRRTEEDLNKPGAILDRARTWFGGTAARWNEKSNLFRFPSNATIHFGYGRTRQEIEDRYQGPEFQFVAAEEVGQWLEEAYLYLFSRLRRLKGFPVPLRMRAAGNPGGRGGPWVRRRFIEYARHVVTGVGVREYLAMRKRGEALPKPPYFRSPPSAQAVAVAREFGREAQGAYFVPAFARDNPGLDLADYMAQLVRLDPATRAQLEDGDWWAVGGGKFFQEEYFNGKYLEAMPPGLRTIRYWDLAATKPRKGRDPDWSAGVRLGIERLEGDAKRIIIVHVRRFREDSGETEQIVKGVASADTRKVPVHIEEEPGSAGKNNTHNYAARVLFGFRVEGHRKTGPKTEYWKALSAAARNGLLYLVTGEWTEEFVRELCALTDDDSHAHDDQADAAAGGLSRLVGDTSADRARALVKGVT